MFLTKIVENIVCVILCRDNILQLYYLTKIGSFLVIKNKISAISRFMLFKKNIKIHKTFPLYFVDLSDIVFSISCLGGSFQIDFL